MTNSATTKFVLTLIVILWIALLGCVLTLSILDFDLVGYFGWHLNMNSISIGLCISIILLTLYHRKSREFVIDWRKILVILLIVFPLSTLFGYRYDWGLYLIPLSYSAIFILFLTSAVLSTWRIAGIVHLDNPQSRRFWRVTSAILAVLITIFAIWSW